ncbi:MAG: hypothetical protein ACLVGX_00395 [Oscillospiraceae bacterium]
MAAPGYLVFPGKAFHCDILLNIGVHFKAGRIQFLEFFRVIPPEQRKSYDAAASYAELSAVLRRAYGSPAEAEEREDCRWEQWPLGKLTLLHSLWDRFGPEEHLHVSFSARRVDMPSKQTGEIDRFLAVRNTLLPDLPA